MKNREVFKFFNINIFSSLLITIFFFLPFVLPFAIPEKNQNSNLEKSNNNEITLYDTNQEEKENNNLADYYQSFEDQENSYFALDQNANNYWKNDNGIIEFNFYIINSQETAFDLSYVLTNNQNYYNPIDTTTFLPGSNHINFTVYGINQSNYYYDLVFYESVSNNELFSFQNLLFYNQNNFSITLDSETQTANLTTNKLGLEAQFVSVNDNQKIDVAFQDNQNWIFTSEQFIANYDNLVTVYYYDQNLNQELIETHTVNVNSNQIISDVYFAFEDAIKLIDLTNQVAIFEVEVNNSNNKDFVLEYSFDNFITSDSVLISKESNFQVSIPLAKNATEITFRLPSFDATQKWLIEQKVSLTDTSDLVKQEISFSVSHLANFSRDNLIQISSSSPEVELTSIEIFAGSEIIKSSVFQQSSSDSWQAVISNLNYHQNYQAKITYTYNNSSYQTTTSFKLDNSLLENNSQLLGVDLLNINDLEASFKLQGINLNDANNLWEYQLYFADDSKSEWTHLNVDNDIAKINIANYEQEIVKFDFRLNQKQTISYEKYSDIQTYSVFSTLSYLETEYLPDTQEVNFIYYYLPDVPGEDLNSNAIISFTVTPLDWRGNRIDNYVYFSFTPNFTEDKANDRVIITMPFDEYLYGADSYEIETFYSTNFGGSNTVVDSLNYSANSQEPGAISSTSINFISDDQVGFDIEAKNSNQANYVVYWELSIAGSGIAFDQNYYIIDQNNQNLIRTNNQDLPDPGTTYQLDVFVPDQSDLNNYYQTTFNSGESFTEPTFDVAVERISSFDGGPYFNATIDYSIFAESEIYNIFVFNNYIPTDNNWNDNGSSIIITNISNNANNIGDSIDVNITYKSDYSDVNTPTTNVTDTKIESTYISGGTDIFFSNNTVLYLNAETEHNVQLQYSNFYNENIDVYYLDPYTNNREVINFSATGSSGRFTLDLTNLTKNTFYEIEFFIVDNVSDSTLVDTYSFTTFSSVNPNDITVDIPYVKDANQNTIMYVYALNWNDSVITDIQAGTNSGTTNPNFSFNNNQYVVDLDSHFELNTAFDITIFYTTAASDTDSYVNQYSTSFTLTGATDVSYSSFIYVRQEATKVELEITFTNPSNEIVSPTFTFNSTNISYTVSSSGSNLIFTLDPIINLSNGRSYNLVSQIAGSTFSATIRFETFNGLTSVSASMPYVPNKSSETNLRLEAEFNDSNLLQVEADFGDGNWVNVSYVFTGVFYLVYLDQHLLLGETVKFRITYSSGLINNNTDYITDTYEFEETVVGNTNIRFEPNENIILEQTANTYFISIGINNPNNEDVLGLITSELNGSDTITPILELDGSQYYLTYKFTNLQVDTNYSLRIDVPYDPAFNAYVYNFTAYKTFADADEFFSYMTYTYSSTTTNINYYFDYSSSNYDAIIKPTVIIYDQNQQNPQTITITEYSKNYYGVIGHDAVPQDYYFTISYSIGIINGGLIYNDITLYKVSVLGETGISLDIKASQPNQIQTNLVQFNYSYTNPYDEVLKVDVRYSIDGSSQTSKKIVLTTINNQDNGIIEIDQLAADSTYTFEFYIYNVTNYSQTITITTLPIFISANESDFGFDLNYVNGQTVIEISYNTSKDSEIFSIKFIDDQGNRIERLNDFTHDPNAGTYTLVTTEFDIGDKFEIEFSYTINHYYYPEDQRVAIYYQSYAGGLQGSTGIRVYISADPNQHIQENKIYLQIRVTNSYAENLNIDFYYVEASGANQTVFYQLQVTESDPSFEFEIEVNNLKIDTTYQFYAFNFWLKNPFSKINISTLADFQSASASDFNLNKVEYVNGLTNIEISYLLSFDSQIIKLEYKIENDPYVDVTDEITYSSSGNQNILQANNIPYLRLGKNTSIRITFTTDHYYVSNNTLVYEWNAAPLEGESGFEFVGIDPITQVRETEVLLYINYVNPYKERVPISFYDENQQLLLNYGSTPDQTSGSIYFTITSLNPDTAYTFYFGNKGITNHPLFGYSFTTLDVFSAATNSDFIIDVNYYQGTNTITINYNPNFDSEITIINISINSGKVFNRILDFTNDPIKGELVLQVADYDLNDQMKIEITYTTNHYYYPEDERLETFTIFDGTIQGTTGVNFNIIADSNQHIQENKVYLQVSFNNPFAEKITAQFFYLDVSSGNTKNEFYEITFQRNQGSDSFELELDNLTIDTNYQISILILADTSFIYEFNFKTLADFKAASNNDFNGNVFYNQGTTEIEVAYNSNLDSIIQSIVIEQNGNTKEYIAEFNDTGNSWLIYFEDDGANAYFRLNDDVKITIIYTIDHYYIPDANRLREFVVFDGIVTGQTALTYYFSFSGLFDNDGDGDVSNDSGIELYRATITLSYQNPNNEYIYLLYDDPVLGAQKIFMNLPGTQKIQINFENLNKGSYYRIDFSIEGIPSNVQSIQFTTHDDFRIIDESQIRSLAQVEYEEGSVKVGMSYYSTVGGFDSKILGVKINNIDLTFDQKSNSSFLASYNVPTFYLGQMVTIEFTFTSNWDYLGLSEITYSLDYILTGTTAARIEINDNEDDIFITSNSAQFDIIFTNDFDELLYLTYNDPNYGVQYLNFALPSGTYTIYLNNLSLITTYTIDFQILSETSNALGTFDSITFTTLDVFVVATKQDFIVQANYNNGTSTITIEIINTFDSIIQAIFVDGVSLTYSVDPQTGIISVNAPTGSIGKEVNIVIYVTSGFPSQNLPDTPLAFDILYQGSSAVTITDSLIVEPKQEAVVFNLYVDNPYNEKVYFEYLLPFTFDWIEFGFIPANQTSAQFTINNLTGDQSYSGSNAIKIRIKNQPSSEFNLADFDTLGVFVELERASLDYRFEYQNGFTNLVISFNSNSTAAIRQAEINGVVYLPDPNWEISQGLVVIKNITSLELGQSYDVRITYTTDWEGNTTISLVQTVDVIGSSAAGISSMEILTIYDTAVDIQLNLTNPNNETIYFEYYHPDLANSDYVKVFQSDSSLNPSCNNANAFCFTITNLEEGQIYDNDIKVRIAGSTGIESNLVAFNTIKFLEAQSSDFSFAAYYDNGNAVVEITYNQNLDSRISRVLIDGEEFTSQNPNYQDANGQVTISNLDKKIDTTSVIEIFYNIDIYNATEVSLKSIVQFSGVTAVTLDNVEIDNIKSDAIRLALDINNQNNEIFTIQYRSGINGEWNDIEVFEINSIYYIEITNLQPQTSYTGDDAIWVRLYRSSSLEYKIEFETPSFIVSDSSEITINFEQDNANLKVLVNYNANKDTEISTIIINSVEYSSESWIDNGNGLIQITLSNTTFADIFSINVIYTISSDGATSNIILLYNQPDIFEPISSLSTGAIIGITLGSVAFVALIIIYFIFRKVKPDDE